MNWFRINPLLLMIMLSIFYTMIIHTDLTHSQSEYRVLLLYIPGLPMNYFNETYSPLYDKWNNTYVVKIDSEPPYTLLYHELLLINTSWNLASKLVLKDRVVVNNESIEPYRALDYRFINNTWGSTSTVFINTRSVDIKIHNRTLNPYYNFTYRYFPPQLFTLGINKTINWSLLNTTINVTYVNNTFYITIEGYRRNVVFRNKTLDTDPMLINITSTNLKVYPGVYNIKFRIVNYTETNVTIFTPGGFEQYNWLSPFYGVYTKPIIPLLPIEYFKDLEVDDIEWVFNETISFYMDMAGYAYRHREASLYVFTIPLYEEIYYAVANNYVDKEIAVNLTNYLIQFIKNLIDTTRNRIGETYVAIYVPYVYVNESLNNINIPGLEYEALGMYRVIGNLTNVLGDLLVKDIDFNMVKHGGEYYVLIKYRNYMINDIGRVDSGYFILYPSIRNSKAMVVNQRTIIGYITAFVHGYGLGFININEVIRNLISDIRRLRDQVAELKERVSSLNGTLTNTQLELGRCRSDYLNISSLMRDLRNEIDVVKNREMKWMVYALAGTASIFAILIVMYLIGVLGLRRK